MNAIADRKLAILAKIDLLEMHKKAVMAAKEGAMAKDASLPPENSRGFDCGFAWVQATYVKASTKQGKELRALGFSKAYPKGLQLWYRKLHSLPTQSASVHEAAAQAYVQSMKDQGCDIAFTVGARFD